VALDERLMEISSYPQDGGSVKGTTQDTTTANIRKFQKLLTYPPSNPSEVGRKTPCRHRDPSTG
jgi:hypothetical protein